MCDQVVLDQRADGDSRLEKLKVTGQALLERHREREGKDLHDVIGKLKNAELQWDSVWRSAVEQHRYSLHKHKCCSPSPYSTVYCTVYVYMVGYTVIFMHGFSFVYEVLSSKRSKRVPI